MINGGKWLFRLKVETDNLGRGVIIDTALAKTTGSFPISSEYQLPTTQEKNMSLLINLVYNRDEKADRNGAMLPV